MVTVFMGNKDSVQFLWLAPNPFKTLMDITDTKTTVKHDRGPMHPINGRDKQLIPLAATAKACQSQHRLLQLTIQQLDNLFGNGRGLQLPFVIQYHNLRPATGFTDRNLEFVDMLVFL